MGNVISSKKLKKIAKEELEKLKIRKYFVWDNLQTNIDMFSGRNFIDTFYKKSPVFFQENEKFVAVLCKDVKNLYIYCCSSLQWDFNEEYTLTIIIKIKNKFKTRASFTRIRPFCCIKIPDIPDKLSIKIKLPINYGYTRKTNYIGLRNSGSTCYMASILQVLYHTSSFRQLIYNFKSSPPALSELQKLFVDIQLRSQPPKIDNFIRALGSINDIALQQHDANEFFLSLLGRLEIDLGKDFTKIIDSLFCTECTTTIVRDDEVINVITEKINNIPVTVFGLKNLNESLGLYTSEQTLSDYFVGGVKTKVKKYTRFSKLPCILPIHLCRFQFSSGKPEVITSSFICPLEFDMKGFVSDSFSGETTYDLFAVVAHSGTPERGHYISFIKVSGQWIVFDDTRTSQCGEKEVINLLTQTDSRKFLFGNTAFLPYFLFYIRMDSKHHIEDDDTIPIHLAPYRSTMLFSKFVFEDEYRDSNAFETEPYQTWDSPLTTIGELLEKSRPSCNLSSKKVFCFLPGSILVGPIGLDEMASNFVIKGHSTIFYVVGKHIVNPVFLRTYSLPRKIIDIVSSSDLPKYVEQYELIYQGRTLTSYDISMGAIIDCKVRKFLTLNIDDKEYTYNENYLYTDLLSELAAQKNIPTCRFLLLSKSGPCTPKKYPTIKYLPKEHLVSHELTTATLNSLKLFYTSPVLVVLPQFYVKISDCFFIRKGSSASDIIKSAISPSISNLKYVLSKGTESYIGHVYEPNDIPGKKPLRIDSVSKRLPLSRTHYRDSINKKISFSIEVRVLNLQIQRLQSRLVSIKQSTTLREIIIKQKLWPNSHDPLTTQHNLVFYLFLSENTHVRHIIEDINDVLFPLILSFTDKMTIPNQRICIGIDYDFNETEKLNKPKSLSILYNSFT